MSTPTKSVTVSKFNRGLAHLFSSTMLLLEAHGFPRQMTSPRFGHSPPPLVLKYAIVTGPLPHPA
jgi:hypothetical protein